MTTLFDEYTLPLDQWLQVAADWTIHAARPLTIALRWPVDVALGGFQQGLLALPVWLTLALFLIIGWRTAGWRTGVFAAASMLFIGLIGLWTDALTTLAVVLSSVLFTVVLGVLLGIAGAQSRRLWLVLRPILDIMQSTPSLVYLVPVVMLFGIGTVPGVIATMMFAVPPMIRLTYLGLTQVPEDIVEAGNAFGSTSLQTLWHVRLPLARPAIATGVNQVIMFSMVMSAIVSMIGAEGLGAVVLRAVSRLDLGLAGTSAIAIVLMAISLDRMTQPLGRHPERQVRRPVARAGWQRLPAGLIRLVSTRPAGGAVKPAAMTLTQESS